MKLCSLKQVGVKQSSSYVTYLDCDGEDLNKVVASAAPRAWREQQRKPAEFLNTGLEAPSESAALKRLYSDKDGSIRTDHIHSFSFYRM